MRVLLIILGIIAGIIILITVLLHFSVKAFIDANKNHADITVKYLGFTVYRLKIPDADKSSEKASGVPTDEHDTSPPPSENTDAVPSADESQPEFTLTEISAVDSTDREERQDECEKIQEKSEEPDKPEKDESGPIYKEDSAKAENIKSDGASEKAKKPKKPHPSLLEMWNEYKQYIPAAKKAFRKLLKLIRIYDIDFSLTVGNDDPYKAGLNFGRINAAVYSVLGLLCTLFDVSIKHTEIKCDFEKKVTDFSVSTIICVRPSAVIALAAYIGVYYLKIRNSKKKLEQHCTISS